MQGRVMASRSQGLQMRDASRCQGYVFKAAESCTQRTVTTGRFTRATLLVRAGPVDLDEEDLLQVPDRLKWYESKFCADDMPDWNVGRLIRSEQMAPGSKRVVLEMEIGREKVPLRNAYKTVGQRALVRVNSGADMEVTVASPPFPEEPNRESLFKIRGDLFAGEIKKDKPEPTSVFSEITLLVSKQEAPDLYNMEGDDYVETGPFKGAGLDIKSSPMMAIYLYPTIVIFASGKGIAHARALIEATPDVPNLYFKFRKDVRLYYKVPNDASICFREDFNKWESLGVKVTTTTSKTFYEAFDDDDTLVYNPETTGVVILTGGDAAEDKDAREACKDAEITAILSDISEPEQLVKHLVSSPTSFTRWVEASQRAAEARAEAAAEKESSSNGNGNSRH